MKVSFICAVVCFATGHWVFGALFVMGILSCAAIELARTAADEPK